MARDDPDPLLAGLDDICWAELPGGFPADDVPAIVRGLASSDPDEVAAARWTMDEDQCLLHQGTVYPATVLAIPFLMRIAAREQTLWRAELITDLAQYATGYDTVGDRAYSPAGTANAVRDAIADNLDHLRPWFGIADGALGPALVMLAASFPGELPEAGDLVRQVRYNPAAGLVDMLIAATCVLDEPSVDDLGRLERIERESVYLAVRRGDVIIQPPPGSTQYREDELTPVVGTPVHSMLLRWLAEGRPHFNAATSVQLARLVHDLYWGQL